MCGRGSPPSGLRREALWCPGAGRADLLADPEASRCRSSKHEDPKSRRVRRLLRLITTGTRKCDSARRITTTQTVVRTPSLLKILGTRFLNGSF